MSVTINAFPPLHAFTSARSWFLAIIVLLHVGFFLVLSTGLSQSLVTIMTPPPVARFIEDVKRTPPPPPPPANPLVRTEPFVPLIEVPNLGPIDEETRTIQGSSTPPPPATREYLPEPRPMVTLPQIDQRHGLSEPLYPPQEIRLSHTGTVLLSVYVLENGRVGEVRLDQSSGYERLDESALREARKWRFEPGMRDGSPVAMWKQVPIRFRLKE